jgi:hypothetical protein
VSLEETDRLLACPFCRVKLLMTSKGPFRYCLDLKEPVKDVIYLPYWRFRGTLYSVVPYQIDPQILDASILATTVSYAPQTLGLRPQTLRLRFAVKGMAGKFAGPRIPFDYGLKLIERQLEGIRVDGGQGAIEKAYIADTTSIVFAPYYVQGVAFYDAILKKPVGRVAQAGVGIDPSLLIAHEWTPGFVPAMCPECGWDLKGERDSSVFLCGKCNSAWQPRGDSFLRIGVGTIKGTAPDMVHLPFWKISASISGVPLATYADLIRVANLPKAIKAQDEKEPFAFFVPAFKVHPHMFLRIARQVTSSPFKGPVEDALPSGASHPVNLPLAEAVQGLKIVFATFAKPRQTMFQRLPEIVIRATKGVLVYAPCFQQGAELVQPELGFGIAKQALFYGRSL